MTALQSRERRSFVAEVPPELYEDELDRHRMVIAALMFEPLPEGVRSRADALHVLGFPPNAAPDRWALHAKFRLLATIYHPDCPYGSHRRMCQINEAMQILGSRALVSPFSQPKAG
jgi:hypothetical protein